MENEERYQIAEAGTHVFLIDVFDGRTWILRGADSKPSWLPISAVGKKENENG
jgi:hypothetical protein